MPGVRYKGWPGRVEKNIHRVDHVDSRTTINAKRGQGKNKLW